MKDLSQYEVVYVSNDSCNGCCLSKVEGCVGIFKWVTGDYCGSKILKKKEKWVQCTKDNTKAGDIVRNLISKEEREVAYIAKDTIAGNECNCVLQYPSEGEEYLGFLSNYEIEVKE